MPDPYRPMSLADAYAAAWLEALGRRPVLRPLTTPPSRVPLDDTDRPPLAPLSDNRGTA